MDVLSSKNSNESESTFISRTSHGGSVIIISVLVTTVSALEISIPAFAVAVYIMEKLFWLINGISPSEKRTRPLYVSSAVVNWLQFANC